MSDTEEERDCVVVTNRIKETKAKKIMLEGRELTDLRKNGMVKEVG